MAAEPEASIPSIVVVEDDDASRIVLRDYLEDLGYRVLATASAAEALAMLDREAVDLLLTDVSLPDMRGDRLVRRARERLPGLPVVYMSGYDRSELELGLDAGFCRKPFDLDEVEHVIAAQLRRSRPQ